VLDVVDVVTELIEELLAETLVDVDVVDVVTELVDEGTALNNATIVPGELIIAFVVADDEFVNVMLEFVSHPTNS
jgi:hypothetical protein